MQETFLHVLQLLFKFKEIQKKREAGRKPHWWYVYIPVTGKPPSHLLWLCLNSPHLYPTTLLRWGLWWTENNSRLPTNAAEAFTLPRAQSSNYTQRALNNNLLPLWQEANSMVVLWKINNSRGLRESCRALCALNPNYSDEVLQPWARSTSLHHRVPLRDLCKSLIFLSGSSWRRY